jgi:histidinol phosphatase-like PHP family hydrolase
MPLPIDYHNHPQAHSVRTYTPELLQPWADSARAKGLKQVAFTDHDRYKDGVDFDQIDRLREKNPDLIFLAGIELDNDPETGAAGRFWVEKNWDRLDFVLGSAHYLAPETEMFDQVTRKDEFAKRDIEADCAQYLAELNGMLDRGGIDCLAHLDLIKIHGVWKPAMGSLRHPQAHPARGPGDRDQHGRLAQARERAVPAPRPDPARAGNRDPLYPGQRRAQSCATGRALRPPGENSPRPEHHGSGHLQEPSAHDAGALTGFHFDNRIPCAAFSSNILLARTVLHLGHADDKLLEQPAPAPLQ